MDTSFWLKQTKDRPLFTDLLWSRPENRLHAGKILIIGGSQAGFRAPADAYGYASKAGAGTIRILLPDSLRKTVGESLLDIGEYAPSTPSGSFSYRAFADVLAHSNWADGVLLSGDFGKNSETSQLLEYFINKYTGPLTIAGDTIDHFLKSPTAILDRAQTTIILSFQELQKIAASSNATKAFLSHMPIANFALTIHEFAHEHQAALIVEFESTIFIAHQGFVSSMQISTSNPLKQAAGAIVWHVQNPQKQFEALTTSLV